MAGNAQQRPLNLIDQVRTAVRSSGRLQSDLSKATGISPTRLSRFLQGEGLTMERFDALVRELGLELRSTEDANENRAASISRRPCM